MLCHSGGGTQGYAKQCHAIYDVLAAGVGPWVSDTAVLESAANTTTFRAPVGEIDSGPYPASASWTFNIVPANSFNQMLFELEFVLFDVECDNDKVIVEWGSALDGTIGVPACAFVFASLVSCVY